MSGRSDLKPNALALAYVDYDKLLADFLFQVEAANAARWAMGDLVCALSRTIYQSPELRSGFAQQGLTLRTFARQAGVAASQLNALRLTAEMFPLRERHPGLTWEHHWALAHLAGECDRAVRRKWLREAGKRQWSPRQLRQRFRPSEEREDEGLEERVRSLRAQLRAAEAKLKLTQSSRSEPKRTKKRQK